MSQLFLFLNENVAEFSTLVKSPFKNKNDNQLYILSIELKERQCWISTQPFYCEGLK